MHMMIAKTASVLWVNSLLRQYDAVCFKIKTNISFDLIMELHKALVSGSMELFPSDTVARAVKKSS